MSIPIYKAEISDGLSTVRNVKERISGIYRIWNIVDNKSYIGSSNHIYHRFEGHISNLKNNKHYNKLLQKDYNLLGDENFKFEILEIINTNSDLLLNENKWINNSINLYNKTIFSNINLTDKDISRFWSKVNKGNENECWNWLGKPNPGGYGELRTKNKLYRAPRIMYFLLNGIYDFNKMVCHTCDNRMCVNPKHLYLGSHQDNARDIVNRDRHPTHKLNFDIVKRIREKYKEIGKSSARYIIEWVKSEYNINISHVSIILILNNETYTDKEYFGTKVNDFSCEQHSNTKFTWNIVNEIRRLKAENDVTNRAIWKFIQNKYNISVAESSVTDVINLKRWVLK